MQQPTGYAGPSNRRSHQALRICCHNLLNTAETGQQTPGSFRTNAGQSLKKKHLPLEFSFWPISLSR